MKKILVSIFALTGILWLLSGAVGFYQRESRTQEYWENCDKVEVGMTLDQARRVIGDLKYQYWTQDNRSGEIIIHNQKGVTEYTLEYDMIFGGSDNMKLYFDPETLLITDKFCGE